MKANNAVVVAVASQQAEWDPTVHDFRDFDYASKILLYHQLAALINENGRSIGYGELIRAQDSTLKSQIDEMERLNTMLSNIRT